MPKVKSTLIWRILLIVICTVLLSALLTVLVFSHMGGKVMAGVKVDELLPKARYIGDVTSLFLENSISEYEYKSYLGQNNNIWDASLYVVNPSGSMIAYSTYMDSMENRKLVEKHLSTVLSGKEVVDDTGLVVGVPVISVYGNVTAGVFLVKPMSDIHESMIRMIEALLVGMCFVLLAMLIPAYLTSISITIPIRRMTRVALGIAEGNFSVEAKEIGRGELATLGRSLNRLSKTLSHTIFALTFERNRLRSILDNMSEGLVALDAYGNVSHFNTAAYKLIGGKGGNLAEDAPMIVRIREAAQELRDDNHIEFRIEDGGITINVSITVLTNEDALYSGAIAVLSDVTEASRLEQARKDYVANVSHELRTPIASIRSLADALNDGLVKKDEDKNRYYGYILTESNRLSRLIDDLLELSRLQSGTHAFQNFRTDMSDIIMYVVDRFHDLAINSDKSIHLDICEELPLVWTNPDRAEQVLVVLLDNALKHTENGSDIEVTARRMSTEDCNELEQTLAKKLPADFANNKVLIRIKNTGSIDKDDVKYLFDRFYKVDKSHSGGGTGLGLAIAKEVMDILGEKIWAESEDGYVSFSFTLEIFDPEKVSPSSESSLKE